MMRIKLIDRYIAKTVLSSILLVTLFLFSLQLFLLFVDEIRFLGRGQFGIWQTFLYVLMQVPYQIYLFFPVASLLGALVGLGVLASHSELIVMRAAGYSITQIAISVLKIGFILIIVVTIVGETLVPKLMFHSENYKTELITGGKALRTQNGVWIRDSESFIFIHHVASEHQLRNVIQYKFTADNTLTFIRQAKNASYQEGEWHLSDIQESQFLDDKVETQAIHSQIWQTNLTPRMLSVAIIEPDEMSLAQLGTFIEEQKRNLLQVRHYELSFWKRIFQPISSCVMLLLAIPFIFGPLRSATMGARFLFGVTCGFGFYVLNQFFTPISEVYHLPPLLGAMGPTLIFALIAIFMIRRIR